MFRGLFENIVVIAKFFLSFISLSIYVKSPWAQKLKFIQLRNRVTYSIMPLIVWLLIKKKNTCNGIDNKEKYPYTSKPSIRGDYFWFGLVFIKNTTKPNFFYKKPKLVQTDRFQAYKTETELNQLVFSKF